MRLRRLPIVLAPVLLLLAGCGAKKLNESAKLTLDKDYGAKGHPIPAQKNATKVTVEFSSSDGDVQVLVFKKSDLKDDDAMLTVEASKALGKARGKADSFMVDIPEGTAVMVVARGHTAAKTDVTVKVVEH